ncbi:uncharacterized protein LOC122374093 [Amphibalanus amphitrite]|uniref:uncharacterized protein LOC122365812 n=1 Tax=Amphibalanus amphitrite TaxID=1232801 RepID=UPI001C9176DD|nr:uncharacterized protein LOC122365812 [Amphibalanus amphitrite]XP_043193312.1 uncharacterized protein LOC122365812 [Amphibalanus amphitrite]XP_043208571.1 uncharacterized protein LOC122374093 [Amphibalanus amphitrite]XP_043208572.1 uncharacterized protein LOC122374093 [Amphibalanus amphitrite]
MVSSLFFLAVCCSLCVLARGQSSADEFRCESAGYHEDPNNCALFYRCISFWGGKQLRRVSFSCKEPTVYDANLSVCQFPWRLKPPCVKNTDGIWVRESRLPTVLPPTEALPNITVVELGSPDYVPSPPPKYRVAAGSPYNCPGPGEYFADIPDSCVFYYQCLEIEPGVLNAELHRCRSGEIITSTSGGCIRPFPLPDCAELPEETLRARGLPLAPESGSRLDDERDFYLELEFKK